MRHYWTILSHEIRMLLVNPSTYIAAFLFLVVMGFIFTGILESYSKPMEASPVSSFFELFWVPVFFMVPLLTMKSISEERRLGTLETLLTAPVTTVEVVLGKYSAAYCLYMALWASTGGLFYILGRFDVGGHLLNSAPIIGGYLFVAISGMFFVGIGILASSLSRNQAVASILSFSMLFLIIVGLHLLDGVELLQRDVLHPVRTVVDYAQVFQHLADFSRGIVDTRQVLFYASGTVLSLIFSILSVEAKLIHS